MTDPIKNIIFDLGGVLVGFDSRRSIGAFNGLGCEKVSKYIEEHRTEDLFYRIEFGISTTQEFCEEVRQMTATTAPDEAIVDAWNALLTPVTQARRQQLHALREAGYRLFLLSNTNDMHWQLCRPQLEGCFRRAFLSYQMRLAKPDMAIFSEVLQQAGIEAGETLFIDDNADNVAAAGTLGIQTFINRSIDDWMRETAILTRNDIGRDRE